MQIPDISPCDGCYRKPYEHQETTYNGTGMVRATASLLLNAVYGSRREVLFLDEETREAAEAFLTHHQSGISSPVTRRAIAACGVRIGRDECPRWALGPDLEIQTIVPRSGQEEGRDMEGV